MGNENLIVELMEAVEKQKKVIANLHAANEALLEELDGLKAERPNEYEKELGFLPPAEDRNNMSGFIGACIAACWAAYNEISRLIAADYRKRTREGGHIDADKYGARQRVRSWLYDAASVLTVVGHDGKLLSLLREWYDRDGGIPWTRKGDWRKEERD